MFLFGSNYRKALENSALSSGKLEKRFHDLDMDRSKASVVVLAGWGDIRPEVFWRIHIPKEATILDDPTKQFFLLSSIRISIEPVEGKCRRGQQWSTL